MGDHGPAGPAHGVHDGGQIQRHEAAQVQDLDVNAFLGQPLGRLQRVQYGPRRRR